MKQQKIEITTDYIKLDSFLKLSGLAESGGHAKEIVSEGAVRINGEACTQRGRKLHPGDRVVIDDYELEVVAQ